MGAACECVRYEEDVSERVAEVFDRRVELYVVLFLASPFVSPLTRVFVIGNDGSSSGWNPQPVTTTIRFRGQQVCSCSRTPFIVFVLTRILLGDGHLRRRRHDFVVVRSSSLKAGVRSRRFCVFVYVRKG